MTALAQPPIPAKPMRRLRRRAVILLALVLVTIAVPLTAWLSLSWKDEHALAEALADTDRLDPHWRLPELLAGRPNIPPEENAALQVGVASNASGKIYTLFQKHFPEAEADALRDFPADVNLDARQKAMLIDLWVNAVDAIAAARKLKDMPRGRPRITYAPDFISTLVQPVQDAREVCSLLHIDVVIRSEDGDADGAIDSCRAMLNTGRSIGEEPFVIAVLVRCACANMTVNAVERVLARGCPGEPALATMQTALEQELAEPTLLFALRGERAGLLEVLRLMADGKVRPSFVSALASGGKQPGLVGRFLEDHLPARTTADQASLLRGMNKLVEAAKLPVEQQAAAFESAIEEWKDRADSPLLQRKWADMSLSAHLRVEANMRAAVAAVAALAAERYRLKHAQWPASLDALVKAGLLKAVPLDPFDGEPLRLKRLPDGLVIYSVGQDRTDNGGIINRRAEAPAGTDLGFRLWNERTWPAPE
jgi:hypothetical protein